MANPKAHKRRLVCLLAAISFLPACDRGKTAEPANERSAPQAVDPIAGAPVGWDQFLNWASEQLNAEPEKQPIPNAREVDQVWPVIHLDNSDRLSQATVSCDWKPPAGKEDVLAEVGPYSSAAPRPPAFTVQRSPRSTPEGDDSLDLAIGGFEARREEIGAIELEIVAPYGRHVALRWSKAGVILIPVETHDGAFSVRVLTDGFSDWSGPLTQLTLQTDGVGSDDVEVRKLRFLSRQNSYAKPTGVERVRLGHEIRTAVYTHCPTEITYAAVELPENAKLHVGLGCLGSADSPADASFEVIVRHGSESTSIFAKEFSSAEHWADVSASLSQWAGQRVSLSFRTAAADPETLAFWANPTVYTPSADPPILVLYLIDALAAEHTYLGGFNRDTTPRIAEAGASGVVFTNVFSNSSRTIESVSDMMLSMPTERHGVRHSSTAAAQEFVTLAEVLRDSGMATVSFCTNVNAGTRQGMDQGFDTFVDKIGYYWTTGDRTIPLEETMAWIAEHHDRPMFLYIHTAEPHAPYTPPEGFAGRFDPDYSGQTDGTYDPRTGFKAIRNPRERLRDIQHVSALYDEEILYSDARLGMFLDQLRAAGLLDRANIMVTSDHGEEFLQHGKWEHGLDLHNELTRVPLIAFGPLFRSGVRVEQPAQLLDIMPTILDLFSRPQPYELAGASLAPLVSRSAGEEARRALAEKLQERDIFASNHNFRISSGFVEFSLTAGRWKLLHGFTPMPTSSGTPSRFQLYDLDADPHERSNIIDENRELARGLIEKLVRWRVQQAPYDAQRTGPTEVDKRQIDQLIGLGYVGGEDDEDPNKK